MTEGGGGEGVIVFRIVRNLGQTALALLRDESKGGKKEATPSEKGATPRQHQERQKYSHQTKMEPVNHA